jgi:mannose-6-phosphate isomerase-like protein (cupin superfamily)
MQNDVLFYVIEGEGEIIIDSEKEALTAGICVIVPKFAESRSISAKSSLVILAVRAKS